MPTAANSGELLWHDQVHIPKERGKKGKEFRANVRPLEGYMPPDALRPFKHLSRIGFDTETWDPDLTTKGPGAHRDEGFITGVAIAYAVDDPEYYPVQHAGRNMADPETMFKHLRSEALQFEGELVGANLQYDLDWMWKRHDVRFPKAKIRDVQTAEPLLNENRLSYKLGLLGNEYVGEGKATNTLEELYGPGYIENMHNVDAGHAAVYGKRDTTLPWEILDHQYTALESQGLVDLFHMESRLTPLLVQMRQHGVRVDIPRAEEAYEMTKLEADRCKERIKDIAGFYVDAWSAESIARAFDKADMTYPKTATGRPSFRKAWLESHPSELAKLLVDERGFEKIGGTFIHNYILEGNINGRIHCMFNQLRSDEFGTVSGRFSSSYPNLQNIPVRHPILGALCRSIFIPEEGMDWGSADWSQIEYRFLVHYASLLHAEGASRAVRMYHEDIRTDFHELAAQISGQPRKVAKNINFGVVYGMGVALMALSIGCSDAEAADILSEFHTEMPFMRSTYSTASAQAATKGEIRTILGRRRRFNQWEFAGKIFNSKEAAEAYQTDLANSGNRARGRPRRAFTHKALNALLQGSAADLMKKAMAEMYEAGIFNVLVPHLTVHDEMNVSVPRTKAGAEAFKELVHIMESSIKLAVPVLADATMGANWSEAKG